MVRYDRTVTYGLPAPCSDPNGALDESACCSDDDKDDGEDELDDEAKTKDCTVQVMTIERTSLVRVSSAFLGRLFVGATGIGGKSRS
jgi:hypothetical protein